MKKLFSVMIALLFLFSAFPAQVLAVDTPTFALGNGSAKPGETVEIPILVENNPGIVGMMLFVSYDADVLTLVSAGQESLFGEGTTTFGNNLTANPFKFVWENSLSRENYTNSGTFTTLTFQVKDTATAGDTTVSIAYDEGSTFDTDLNDVAFSTRNGTVTVLPAEEGGWKFSEDTTLTIARGESGKDFVVGFDDLMPGINDAVETTGGWSYEVVPNDLGLESTGAMLRIFDETGATVEEYDVVFYGDANGDFTVDAADISLMLAVMNGVSDADWADYLYADEYAGSFAADLTHDFVIDAADISALLDYYNGIQLINQAWTQTGDPLVLDF